MAIDLGAIPDDATINITTGCRFRLDLDLYDDSGAVPWAGGVKIVFDNGVEWAATVTADEAAWNVSAAVAAGVPAGTSWDMIALNPGGDDPDPVYSGRVRAA